MTATTTERADDLGGAAVRELLARHAALKREQPRLRLREAGAALGVSEGELVAAGAAGAVTRLRPDFRALFERLPALGRVMALTRNDACVHERKGRYEAVSGEGHVLLVLGPDIDLRVFLNRFGSAFAVAQETPHGPLSGLQFFDPQGGAVHKVFLQDGSDRAAYERLVADFADPAVGAASRLAVAPPAPRPPERADAEVDVAALLAGWEKLRDTHDFFPLIARLRIAREQALRLATPRFAEPLAGDAVERMLHEAASRELQIMVFTGSPGVIQIHTGPIREVKPMGAWLNVLDPDFNLHLDRGGVARTWRVRKPTEDGVVTAVEAYSPAGELVVQFFGKRKPGVPEDPRWRELAESLPRLEAGEGRGAGS